jgi:hypothetical protein
MINSSDGFVITEHREPPHGQQVPNLKKTELVIMMPINNPNY